MKARYLLDVNTLIALLWDSHDHNERVERWLDTGEMVAVCPLTEIGFLRISTQPNFGATVDQARKMLKVWKDTKKPEFIPCDIETLKTFTPPSGTKTTDFYLAGLAEAHNMKLATLENNLGHKAAFSIPQ
ncbi:MAG TPA: PIN domain-containing protein [Verrucomicrobiae bacterium]|jgi:predicted nucleic acid-binding protein